jgi:hypothetical protein
MALITIAKAMKTDRQSRSLVTSAAYDILAYIRRLTGSAITERIVEIAVMVTLRAKSALNMEHHLRKEDTNVNSMRNLRRSKGTKKTSSYLRTSSNKSHLDYW